MKNKFFHNDTLFILCFFFLIVRFLILSTSPYLYDYEESRIGLIANEIINGPTFPIWEYQMLFGPHEGSLILDASLLVPLFLIFGKSGMTIKLLWLLMSLFTLIVLFLFLNKFFNKKLAIVTSILFIFSPQLFTISSLADGAERHVAIFFPILIALFFYRAFLNPKKDIKNYAFLGIISGIALFLSLHSLVIIFTCILFWYVFDKKFFFKKELFIFIVFFLVGFSPSLYFNFTHDFIGYTRLVPSNFFQDPQTDNFLLVSTSKLFKLLNQDIPNSFNNIDWNFENGDYFEYTFYLKFLNYGYYSIFVISFVYLVFLNRKYVLKSIKGLIPLYKFSIKPAKIGKEIFILAYPIIYFIIYSLSSYNVGPVGWSKGYVYLLPVYPFIFIIISLFIIKLSIKKNKILRYAGSSIFITAILIGIFGNINLVVFDKWSLGNNSPYSPTITNFLLNG